MTIPNNSLTEKINLMNHIHAKRLYLAKLHTRGLIPLDQFEVEFVILNKSFEVAVNSVTAEMDNYEKYLNAINTASQDHPLVNPSRSDKDKQIIHTLSIDEIQ